MNKLKQFALVALFVLAPYTVAHVYAQDTQLPPTQEVIVVTTAAPVPDVTVEPTVTPAPTPDTGISPQVLFLVIVTVAGLVLTVLLQLKSVHDLALQAGELLPAWAWEGLKTASISGLDALEAKAKQTIDTADDVEVARLRQIAVNTINEIDAKRSLPPSPEVKAPVIP